MAICAAPGCYEQIQWRRNDHTGRPMPIDMLPRPDGNITLVGEEHFHVLTKTERHRMDNPGMLDDPAPDRFVSHFSTCCNADYYRHRCKVCHQNPCQCPVGARRA